MKPRTLTCLAAVAALSLTIFPATSQGPPSIIVFGRQPVVVYESSFAGLLGTTHVHLIAYSDGHISFSRGNSGFPLPDVSVFIDVDSETVQAFARELRKAGATTLGDNVTPGFPVNTLTILGPDPTTVAHSFSYDTFSGPHIDVTLAINKFIVTTINPNLP